MASTLGVVPRTALAAPTDPTIIRVQSAVVLVTSVLSVLGAAWIIASFVAFSNLRTFRHQLIFGLAFSDCIMALNFLVSSSMDVAGRWIGAPEQARYCTFNGFITQVFVIQTDYWVLIVAVCTYFVLADHKRCSSWVQAKVPILCALPWLLSITWACIGLGVTGYGDIGAWCWFTSDQVRLLVNFVPRWTIIVIMLVMYGRLYLVLFRAHRHMASLEESGSLSGSGSRQLGGTGGSYAQGTPANSSSRHTRRLKKLARLMLLYPLAYAIVWSLPTGIRIYQTISGEPAPWQVQTLDKACVAVQGLVDAAIYGATESSLSSWRNLFWPRKFPTVQGVEGGQGGGGGGSSGYGGGGVGGGKRGSHRQLKEEEEASWDGGAGADRDGLQFRMVSRASSVRGAGESTSTVDYVGGEELEMGTLGSKRGRGGGVPMTGIRKTMKVEIVSVDGRGTEGGAVSRPPRSYFPDTR